MPPSLQYGIKVALEKFAAHFSNVHFHFFGVEKRFDERMESVLFFIDTPSHIFLI